MSTVRTERVKLTAAYVNASAGGVFTAGVAAPIAAAVFGLTGPASALSALTLITGVAMFLGVSVGLHVAARRILKGVEP